MLSFKERKRILQLLSFFTTVTPLPIEVNARAAKATPGAESKWKAWACKIAHSLFLLNSLYKNFMLIYSVFILRDVPLYQIMIHAILASACAIFSYWYYVECIEHADVTAGFRNLTVNMKVVASALENKKMYGRQELRLWERPLQDLMTIYLPHGVIGACVCILLSFAYEPSMKLLLYAALPGPFQNGLTFWMCMIEETRWLMFMVALIIPVWQTQLTAFEDINFCLKEITDSAGMQA